MIKMMQAVKLCSKRDGCVNPKGPELPLSDFYDQKEKKDGKGYTCKVCCRKYQKDNKEAVNINSKRYRDANPKKVKTSAKAYRASNREKLAVASRKYNLENREHKSASGKKYRQANPEKVREINKAWFKANPEKRNYYTAKRHAAKLQRTVAWADLEAIKQVYADCVEINIAARLAGCTQKFVVDHVIPLQGDNVSGLHVHTNLQIITLSENSKKGKKFIPGSYA